MKKMVTVLAFLTLTIALNAQTLKGVTLGQTTDKDMFTTTVAGIDGYILVGKIKDGRVYSIYFQPSDDGANSTRVYGTDLDRLVAGLEKKYSIKLKKFTDRYTDEIIAYKSSDDTFFIIVDYNQFMTPGYKITLVITDNELKKIHKREKQEEANTDF